MHKGRVLNFTSADAVGPHSARLSFLERHWYLVIAAVMGSWVGLSYFLFTSLGWVGRGVVIGSLAATAIATVLLVRGGARAVENATSVPSDGSQDREAA